MLLTLIVKIKTWKYQKIGYFLVSEILMGDRQDNPSYRELVRIKRKKHVTT